MCFVVCWRVFGFLDDVYFLVCRCFVVFVCFLGGLGEK